MNTITHKFKGGVWIGLWANSWPFGSLEIDKEKLVLRDNLINKEFNFLKNEVEKIVPKKVLPVIGYGIRIYPKSKTVPLYFWAGRKKSFNQLISILKTLNYPLI
jgi:hypothetical protein